MSDPYLDLLAELKELTLKKRSGYSPGEDPFANFRQSTLFKLPCECGCGHATPIPPIYGIMIRKMDKISRIASLLENPDRNKVGESLRDNMLDDGNYSLIGVAYEDSEKAATQLIEDMFEPVEPEPDHGDIVCCNQPCYYCTPNEGCDDCTEDCLCYELGGDPIKPTCSDPDCYNAHNEH